MPLYPDEVNLNQEGLNALIKTLKQSYKDIVDTINGATKFTVNGRKQILAQIEVILSDLGEDVEAFVKEEIPTYYKTGADDAVKQLKNVKADLNIEKKFNLVNKEAIDFLVNETTQQMFEALSGIKRSADLLLNKTVRQVINQNVATGIVAGTELETMKKIIKGVLAEDGLNAIVDKSGRGWSADRYAEMLFRTKAVQARNYGFANRIAQNGYDLVQVSSHFGSCPLCEPWQGKILSVSGQTRGYPTLADAEANGLFHPNCRHAINALIPSLANKTKAYNPDKGGYTEPGDTIKKPILDAVTKQVTKAQEFDETFKASLEQIAKDLGYQFKGGPVKKASRAAEKIINDYNGVISDIKDLNRGVIFINDPGKINELIDRVKRTFEIDRVKNEFGDFVGYQKAMVNVKLPSGNVAEIQVTTKEFWEAKKELGGDDLYHTVRVQAEGWEEALEKMNKLYEEAAQALAARLKAS